MPFIFPSPPNPAKGSGEMYAPWVGSEVQRQPQTHFYVFWALKNASYASF